jgi:hypothetical protein
MAWQSSVPRLVDGQDNSAVVLNAPTLALEARTDWLKARMDSLTSGGRMVVPGIPVEAGASVGDLLAAVPGQPCLMRAVARWMPGYAANGSLLPAPESRVVGVLLNDDGDVLLQGLLDDDYASTVLSAPLAGRAGILWLSSTAPGRTQADPPPLQVPVGTALPGGRVILHPAWSLAPNHIHKTVDLSAGWLPVSDYRFDGMAAPTEAILGYELWDDAEATELFAAYPGRLTLTADGLVLDGGSAVNNAFNIWWTGLGAPPARVRACSHSPLTFGEPVLRAAKTDTPDVLTLSGSNGVLTVNHNPWIHETDVPTGRAVQSIRGSKLVTTPCVTSVVAGPGASVVTGGDGKVTIAMETYNGLPLDADAFNLDNCIEQTSDGMLAIRFPAGRTSSVTGRVVLPRIPLTSQFTANVWVCSYGGSAAPTISVIRVPGVEALTSGDQTVEADLAESLSIAAPGSVPLWHYTTTDAGIQATTADALYVKLTFEDEARVLRFGVVMTMLA